MTVHSYYELLQWSKIIQKIDKGGEKIMLMLAAVKQQHIQPWGTGWFRFIQLRCQRYPNTSIFLLSKAHHELFCTCSGRKCTTLRSFLSSLGWPASKITWHRAGVKGSFWVIGGSWENQAPNGGVQEISWFIKRWYLGILVNIFLGGNPVVDEFGAHQLRSFKMLHSSGRPHEKDPDIWHCRMKTILWRMITNWHQLYIQWFFVNVWCSSWLGHSSWLGCHQLSTSFIGLSFWETQFIRKLHEHLFLQELLPGISFFFCGSQNYTV